MPSSTSVDNCAALKMSVARKKCCQRENNCTPPAGDLPVDPQREEYLRGLRAFLTEYAAPDALDDVRSSSYKAMLRLAIDQASYPRPDDSDEIRMAFVERYSISVLDVHWELSPADIVPEDRPQCGFSEIDCDADGHVTKVNLRYDISVKIRTIPAEICLLRHSREWILSRQQLTGRIPCAQQTADDGPAAGFPTTLNVLRLDKNQLTGTLPPTLFSLTALTSLVLDTNLLSGTLSPAIGNLPALEILSLFDNHFIGTVPDDLERLTRLEVLHLDQNNLLGCCGPGLCARTDVGTLKYLTVDCELVSCPCATQCFRPCWCDYNSRQSCSPPQISPCGEGQTCGAHVGACEEYFSPRREGVPLCQGYYYRCRCGTD
uniref:Uncharacterized protein n=1 Tax=Corethron hystrix TaxID=216773 RepID=A0A7S1BCP7_9STRA|mmetsp:Transcript_22201/g.50853  ORF Transcript_22201/g.50853 Transcript_22201/m.50853 type:complete len:375 (+) Transcript_22201:295-1419(+)